MLLGCVSTFLLQQSKMNKILKHSLEILLTEHFAILTKTYKRETL